MVDVITRREIAYRVVRCIVAVLLLGAAGLKAWQLMTAPIPGHGILASRALQVCLVEFELFLAVALLIDFKRFVVWRITLATIATFLCFSLWKAFSGVESCGCFGQLQVHPWITSLIDALMLVSFVGLRPDVAEPRSPIQSSHLRAATSFALVMGFFLAIGMASYRPAILSTDGVIVGADDTVVLEPKEWLGKTLPLLPYINIDKDLTSGVHEIWLFKSDCPDCQRKLSSIASQGEPVAMVELPPHKQGIDQRLEKNFITCGTLSAKYDWFAELPVGFRVQNSEVTEVLTDALSGG